MLKNFKKKFLIFSILSGLISLKAYAQPEAISDLTALTGPAEGQITLNWTSPDPRDGFSAPSSYLVKYATSDIQTSDFYSDWVSTDTSSWTTLVSSGSNQTHVVTGLVPGTTYYFAVVARDTSTVDGAWSKDGPVNTLNFNPAQDFAPAAIANLTISVPDKLVNLSWQANTETDIKQYNIERSTYSNSAGFTLLAAILYPGTTHQDDSGILYGNTFYYRLSAQDNTGHTGTSVSISTVPWINVDTPVISTGTYNQTSLRWEWTLANNATGYRVINSTSSEIVADNLASSTSFWIKTDLTPNTSFSVYVQAFNELVTANSQHKRVFTLANPPASVTSTEGTTVVNLSWQQNGNSSSTRYTVRRSSVGPSDGDFMVDNHLLMELTVSTTHQDTGLTENFKYYYKIWAANGDGIVIQADVVNYSTWTANIPPSSPFLTSDCKTGTNDSEVELKWNASYDDNGDIYSGKPLGYMIKWATYTLDESVYNVLPTTNSLYVIANIVPPDIESKVITGLYPGTTFWFGIKAIDKVNNYSVLSNTKSISAQDVLPMAPSNLSIAAQTPTTISLQWTIPGYDGYYDDRDGYNLYRATFSFASFQESGVVISTTITNKEAYSYTDENLIPKTTYYYRITTLDTGSQGNYFSSVLESSYSYITSAKTTDTTAPAAITQITALTGSSEGKIDLVWTSPGDDGSVGGITDGEFRIDYSINSNKTFVYTDYISSISTTTSPGDENRITISSLIGGSTYYFRIWTKDPAGNWSSMSDGATIWAQVDVTPPAAVNTLNVSTFWRGAMLSWTSPGDDGNTGSITNGSYEIRASTSGVIDSQTAWDNAAGGIYPYKVNWATSTAQGISQVRAITGLTNSVTYYFAIKTADERNNWAVQFTSASSLALPLNNQPGSFSISSPADNSVSSSWQVQFQWGASTDIDVQYGDAVTYTVHYSTDSNFLDDHTVTTNGTDQIIDLQAYEDKKVYIKVVAADKEGFERISLPSSYGIKINHINTAPAAFNLLEPVTSTITATATPILRWEASNDVDPGDTVTYQVDYSLYEDFRSYSSQAGITNTYFAAPQLTENAVYWWRVWADDGTVKTLCNAIFYFKINGVNEPPNAFDLTSPSVDYMSLSTTVNFSWVAAADPDPGQTVVYDLSYSKSQDFVSSSTVHGLIQATATVSGLDDNSRYYWKVTAIGSDGMGRESNQIKKFYTDTVKEKPNAYELITPTDTLVSSTLTPIFSWNEAIDPDPADEVRYVIEISPNSDFSGLGTMAVSTGRDRYYVPLTNLTDQTTYYWRVKAAGYQYNEAGIPQLVDPGYTYSSNPGIFIMSMKNNPPGAFGLISPSKGETVKIKAPKFTWEKSVDSDVGSSVNYTIYISSDANFSVIFESAPYISSNEYQSKKTYLENRVYYWKVKAEDNKSASTYSSENFSFTIPVLNIPQAPSGIKTVLSSDKMMFTISWSNVSSNTDFSAADDIAGYVVYRGLSTKTMSLYTSLPADILQWSDQDTQGGNLYYRIRTIDTSGIESNLEDSPVLNSLSADTLNLITNDKSLNVEIPPDVSRSLIAENNSYHKDLQFKFEHDTASENDKVISSYKIKIITSDGENIAKITFTQPYTVQFNYGSGTGTAARLASAGINLGEKVDMNVFWHNGIEYMRAGGANNSSEKTVTLKTINLGEFQLRKVSRAASFGVAAINPPKLFTPGIAPYEKIVFNIDNPANDKVTGRIFDLRGESVIDLKVIGDATASNVIFEWDGKTSNGENASKGVYIYQIEGSGSILNGTIMIAR